MTLRRFLAACSIALLCLTACGRRQGLVPNAPTGPQLAKYERILAEQASLNRVPPALLVAIIMVESGGNPRAVSPSGNIGLMQIKRTTAAGYGVTDLYDPVENIKAGARYLHDLLVRFRYNIPLAVAGYNAGAMAVVNARGIPAHTQPYVDRVMGIYNGLPRRAASGACNPADDEPVSTDVKNEANIGGIILGGQPDAADVASGRYGTIINCRPAEEEGNVTGDLVRGTGISYTNIPFTADTLAKEHIDRMRAALDAAKGTTLVHCQGGTRAAVAVAIVLAERAGHGADHVRVALEEAGYDIKGRPYERFIENYFKA